MEFKVKPDPSGLDKVVTVEEMVALINAEYDKFLGSKAEKKNIDRKYKG